MPARRRLLTRATAAMVLSLMVGGAPLHAQRGSGAGSRGASSKAAAAERTAAARGAVDAWIVTRFRGVQLLADSAQAPTAGVESDRGTDAALFPRVESVRQSAAGDTLFALHFGTSTSLRPLGESIAVRLSAPSGAITTYEARILARRAFRAPRLPNAAQNNTAAWRYGWAYAVVTRGRRPSLGFGGWLLLPTTDSASAGYTVR